MLRALLFPLAMLIAVFIVGWQTSPLYKEGQELRKKINPLKEVLNREIAIDNTISSLQMSHRNNESDLALLKEAIPVDDEVQDLIIQVEALLLDNSIFYKSIGISGQDDGKKVAPTNRGENTSAPILQPISISINGLGSYENFMKLMTEIEQLKRLSNLTEISLKFEAKQDNASNQQVGGDVPVANLMNGDLTIDVYKKDVLRGADIQKIFQQAEQKADAEAEAKAKEDGGGVVGGASSSEISD